MEKQFCINKNRYFDAPDPNEKFNNEMVPMLLKLGVTKENMDKVADMFAEMYAIGFSKGYDACDSCSW